MTRRRYEEDEYEDVSGIARFISPSAAVGLVAVLGFFALAWYAYKNGGEQIDPSQAELIAAQGGVLKEAPQDPGGWQAPHQDKTIYNAFGNQGDSGTDVAERLTPAPEEPMDVANAAPSAQAQAVQAPLTPAKSTKAVSPVVVAPSEETPANESKTQAWMSSKLQPNPNEQSVPMTDAERAAGGATATPTTMASEQAVILQEEAVVETAPVVNNSIATSPEVVTKNDVPVETKGQKKVLIQMPEVPQTPVAVKPVVVKQESVAAVKEETPAVLEKPVVKAEEPKKAEVKNEVKATGGSVKLQLAALKSQSEADAFIASAKKKAGSALAGATISTVKADLGEKGTFYRVFAGGYADKATAQKACMALKAKQLDCMVK